MPQTELETIQLIMRLLGTPTGDVWPVPSTTARAARCCVLLVRTIYISVCGSAGVQGDAQRSAGRVAKSAVQLLEEGESALSAGRAVAPDRAWLNSGCIAGVPHAQQCWSRPHERFSDVRS